MTCSRPKSWSAPEASSSSNSPASETKSGSPNRGTIVFHSRRDLNEPALKKSDQIGQAGTFDSEESFLFTSRHQQSPTNMPLFIHASVVPASASVYIRVHTHSDDETCRRDHSPPLAIHCLPLSGSPYCASIQLQAGPPGTDRPALCALYIRLGLEEPRAFSSRRPDRCMYEYLIRARCAVRQRFVSVCTRTYSSTTVHSLCRLGRKSVWSWIDCSGSIFALVSKSQPAKPSDPSLAADNL